MKSLLSVVALFLMIGAISCNQIGNSEPRMKSPEELKQDLGAQERMSPRQYLKVETTLKNDTKKKGLLKMRREADGQTIRGVIENTATIAKFKDVVIQVDYYSKTNTKVGGNTITIYEEFPPKSKIEFKQKLDIPNVTDTYNAYVINAKPM